MTNAFDKDFWERHWQAAPSGSMAGHPPNPYLAEEIGELNPGTALDAGCGAGAEAIWLAARGWQVTAADISAEALAFAGARDPDGQVRWIEADLGAWQPEAQFDLVTTHYAHLAMPQLAFFDHIADWVAPGGTLLIVGHLHSHEHGSDTAATPDSISATLAGRPDAAEWQIVTAETRDRTLSGDGDGDGDGDASLGHAKTIHDVVVRAVRKR